MTDTAAFAAAPITFAPAGPAALEALTDAVERAKAPDPFARVVVVADQQDAATSVRHRLGARERGVINVTVQTGNRLAAELAGLKGDQAGNDGSGGPKRLSRLLETQAVRLVAEDVVREQELAPVGQQRFYRSLADAFRRMAERPEVPSETAGENAVAASSDMNARAEELYAAYREKVASRGYYIPSELPHMAAQAVAKQDNGRRPYVIYYLPRRLSAGDVALAQALRKQGQCEIISGLTGDDAADKPVMDLISRLSGDAAPAPDAGGADPLQRRADEGALRIISAPDPEEEVRTVIRRIAARDAPLHRIAVIYRQANPYASRLRQELDCAGIPYAGAERRRLADTPTGLLLLGLVDLAVAAAAANRPGGGVIDRERLIEWMTTTSVRWAGQNPGRDQGRGIRIPASRWANLALEARANGAPELWRTRLEAYRDKVNGRMRERHGDDYEGGARAAQDGAELIAFVDELYQRLRALDDDGLKWTKAAKQLNDIFNAYRWYGAGETDDDRRNIEEAVSGLSALQEWGAGYSLAALPEAIRSALQSPTDERGQPVGAGVYVGPPAGIVGIEYDAVYAVGMVERQFPPRPRTDPWLADNAAERQREAALERYDFLGAVGAGREVTLCWPAATADRSIAYPSRWLVEAANLLHEKAGGAGRLAYDKIAAGAGSKDWLTTIASREAGLRELPASAEAAPADAADYRMMHLAAGGASLDMLADARMRRALAARAARYDRNHNELTEWDGRVDASSESIAGIGRRERPVSPSALETWAGCPYRYFLGRVLGLSAPPEDEDDTISALERGLLVHKILERFVKEGKATAADLAALAETAFNEAERRGATGHYLLWELEKAKIRASLEAFQGADEEWLKKSLGGELPDESKAEISFGPSARPPGGSGGERTGKPTDLDEVGVSVEGLGEVWFQGKIDRLDAARNDDEALVLVRDFKTGKPDSYVRDAPSYNPRTVANGGALQLPVYTAAARRGYPDATINASYSFPTADTPNNDGRPYNDEQGLGEFHTTLQRIVGMARAGLFPATPDGEGQHSNCRYCDFNRLCPARRRQIWERKGRHDDAVQPYNALGGKAAIKQDE